MSSGGGLASPSDQVRGVPRYDQVYVEGEDDRGLPPLPEYPPVGPEFDPSGSEESYSAIDLKPIHRFIPDSWKSFFRGSGGSRKPCSAPDQNGGLTASYTSCKEGEAKLLSSLPDLGGGRTAMAYTERVEAYRRRHGSMKSWAGLLRVLGCVELLLGAAVFACVCAYIHKDNEWYSMFGYSQPQSQTYGGGYMGMGQGMVGAGAGVYYSGPKTPFVLVVAGLAWVATVVLLVLGMTMYYRTVLLDTGWWPITEFVINLVLAVLYMAAGIAYYRDTTRGGLCYYPMFNNGLSGNFCRTETGQMAALAFLFITMVVYLIGAIMCLKVWRHEVARRYKESLAQR
ncbi:hypothetical protein AAFF_G00374890 [Aldrovandia affinis]|uniref:MARVEL domain-containing protein n=1 Tax=Aldrovandia affinis TaxID=143900 RepID=A0AAD7WM81_9TELE|nr:hypothetical protein AAFF_G00374890 [Aldrovandia affinis]